MSRKLFNSIMIVTLLGGLLLVSGVASAAPAASQPSPDVAAKLPPVAISAMRMNGVHLVPAHEDVVLTWLREDEAIPLNATPEQVKAAVADYYEKFAKYSDSLISPELQQKQLQHEQDIVSGKAGTAAVQPVVATFLAMAVQFDVTSETLHLEVDDGAGNCVMQDVDQPGTLQGGIPAPGPRDNNTIWYTPAQTANVAFYEKLLLGYEGVGRVRMDLTDPVDGKPGINLAGYTLQDYYDHVAGAGNVTIQGSVQGWVSVKHSQGYYGADNCQTGSHYGGAGVPPGALAVDAADAFNAAHPGYYTDTSANAFWPKYDQDGDGVLDTFWLIYAGVGQEAGGGSLGTYALWSHSSDLRYYAAWPEGYKVYEGNPAITTDDIVIGPYTMQPENGDLGVFAEEFGHNFFGLPDLYTTDAENSTGFWSIMASGSWGGPFGGAAPVGMPLWFRMNAWCGVGWCNWQEPMTTLQYNGPATETIIGQLENTPAGAQKGLRVSLPPVVDAIPNQAGTGKAPYTGSGRDQIDITLDREITLAADAVGLLTFDTYWEIETDYDYGYVMVKDGDTWVFLDDLDDIFTEGNPNGGNLGHGLTDFSAAATQVRFDLSAYKGKTITLRLRYKTDPFTTEDGWWVDNVRLDGALVDDFESGLTGWTNSSPVGWLLSPSTKSYTNYYLVEWRGETKYDSMVRTAYVTNYSDVDEWQVERVPYNIPGALVYYRTTKYPSTYSQRPFYADPPSYGPKNKLLVVDMNPGPLRYGASLPYMSYLNSRSASYDAALTLQPSRAFSLSQINAVPAPIVGPFDFSAKPAVTSFHDAMGYYPGYYYGTPCPAGYVCFNNRDGSAVIPAVDKYSVRITDYDGIPLTDLYGEAWTPSWFGSGNPGDEGVQHGLHIALTKSTGDTGTIKTWNAFVDIDGKLTQTPDSKPVILGTDIDVNIKATNIGGMLDGFFFVPISSNTAYVPASVYGGAYPVTASAAAGLAAKYGKASLAVPEGVVADTVVGVAYAAPALATGGTVDFGFHVEATTKAGTIQHTATVYAAGEPLKWIASAPIKIGWTLYLPWVSR